MPRPRVLRPRVEVRDDDTLLLRPSWRFITTAWLLGAGLLTALGFGIAERSVSPGLGVAIVLISLTAFAVATWLTSTREYLLVVGPHGISSPLTPQAPMLGWDRVARVGVGGCLLPGHIEVHLWRDPADHTAGTRLGLFLTPGLAPMTSRRLRREIDQRRTRHGPENAPKT